MTAPEEQSKDYSTIRKGIYLSALIYIEGNQAPAANFSAVAKSALKARLMSDSGQDGLTVSLRKIEEQTNMEEKDTAGGQAPQAGGEKSDKSGKAHFEF